MTETHGVSGKVFKHLRENRGLSLKEAAADIVTPQFLGRFEKGQSSLSIDNFFPLLNNIGVNLEEWGNVYQELFPSEFTKRQIEVINLVHKEQYAQSVKLVNQPLDENIPYYWVVAHRVVTKVGAANMLGESFLTETDWKEIEFVKTKLIELEVWGKIEYNVYAQLLVYFNDEFVLFKLKQLINNLKSGEDGGYNHFFQGIEYLFLVLKASLEHLSKKGYYDEVEECAKDIIGVMEVTPQLGTYFLEAIDINMRRAYNLLRQDNVAGVELSQEIIQTLSQFQKLCNSFNVNKRQEHFFKNVTQLNKTGKVINP
ncbi:TPA: helix-turn-helix transcriptional regulator [Streptococcus suis]|nr:helix-turn-helix transcriptional regulator [Streptococcus suis]HEM5996708.1 helix-turn-helix transcriptional regulator [Streptococcus suis]HEM6190219.1 helix-turn-helix transcriptional regulator [Streptococcus suis]HEM6220127.1 helix-turn-helix transcriptional regulator [Streptococcus suis]HEM6290460.1 helix-turn-helix transcriptional regulator [Streptococcus suis]